MSGELTDIEYLYIFCINFMIPSNLSAKITKEDVIMQHKKALSLILAILLLSSMAAAQAFGQEAEKEIPLPTMQTIYVDGQSVQMEVYSVSGSDYVKLSDLANALNLNVYWDNGIHVQSSNAGTALASGIPANTAPTAAGGMTEAEAKAIALADAGVQESDAFFLKVKTDREHGIMVYEIDFYSNGMEYDYDIDISTGEIVGKSQEAEIIPAALPQQAAPAAPQAAPAQSAAAPVDGEEAAIQAALTHAGVNRNETVGMRVKTDWEFSGKVYEVEFHVGRTEYNYDIGSDTFEILSWEVDTDD